MSAPRVWVTRAQPGADATAGKLRALGFEPFVAPLIEVRPRSVEGVDLTGIAALAFTSANGAAAFAAGFGERDMPVFAVGGATAAAARAAGFRLVMSADGDVAALTDFIGARAPFAGEILHPCAAEPAGDLVGALDARDVRARAVVVYETTSRPLDAGMAAALPSLSAVLLHSPKAARILAAYLATNPAPRLAAVCLSEAVAAPLRSGGTERVFAALEPSETSLLSLLGALGLEAW